MQHLQIHIYTHTDDDDRLALREASRGGGSDLVGGDVDGSGGVAGVPLAVLAHVEQRAEPQRAAL